MWPSHEVEANGLTFHYLRTGGAKPALVLAHGSTDNGGCWGRVAAALADTYDVIAPDARGHGRSSAPEGDYSHVAMATDLAAFIGALGLERPFVGGHSMGANTALTLIAHWPELARAAILEDPVFRLEPPAPPESNPWRDRLIANHRSWQTQTHAEVVAAGRAGSPRWHDDEFAAWADAKKHVSAAYVHATGASVPFDWRALLGQVRIPTLLVTSDAPPLDNGIVSPEAAEIARGLCPTLEVAHLPGAGHNIRREQFGPFVASVEAFLARH